MIEFITFLISITGLLLLGTLFSATRMKSRKHNVKKYRSHTAGLVDLLNYAAVVDDGVIIGKNGSFMAAWLYQGEDIANTTDEAREMMAFRINQAMSSMGNGWMIHVDAIRRAAPGYSDCSASYFPDLVSKAVDEERRQYFESIGALYEGYFVITLTWYPPVLAQKRFVELMFDDSGEKLNHKAKTHQLIETFKQSCRNFESRMSAALHLERLGSEVFINENIKVTQDNFLRHIQYCVTGINHPVNLPKNPIYLDALIGGQELIPGITPKIGRKFIQCVAIEGFPMESYPGILTLLTQLPVEYRWNSRFIFMDPHEAVAHFTKFRKKWKQKVRGFFDQMFNTSSGIVDEDALSMVNDAQAAIAETNSGMVGQGYYTSVVVLMDEDRANVEKAALFIEKNINALGFSARTETINTMDAYMGSLPGHGVENIRRPLMNTMNLADLLPTSSIWTGENKAPCPLFPPQSPPLLHCVTSGNAPFRLNLHVRDLGHGIMFGPTRSGKSTHLGLLALSWRRYKDARIYSFDKGMSMYPTCKATGGEHFTIAGKDSRLAFAPLQFLETKADRAWAMEWIDTILALNGLNTTPAQRNEIGHAILSMHQSGSKTLSEFVMTIQDEPIRETLKQYTIDGLMGHLLDAESDGLGLSSFMTFEIEHLMGLGEKFALPVLLYLFRRIETSLDGRPTLILLDEAWLMLAHPVFKNKIAEWLDSMAKKNCVVFMATQHLSHAANSGILDIIVESTATKIFLPNLYARDPETRLIYERMGLNPRQIDIIASAQPKRDYYYVSEKGQRLYQLALGPYALAFVGATDPDSIARMKQLESKYEDEWVSQWLSEKGIHLAQYGEAA
ncbi:TPA: conjugal transfer protein TrbE [Legionella pneumophila]|uniref:Conjugal transfer protein trbE n=1 Tax=Legionella pneumophila subsp. pneumophila TaxID=91891 RepID=A0AAV2UZM5_LEGPN|nr:conjugal transfer protein TrbE [Legionella pneumophila]AMQ28651.1 conjugal transfer protein TrbE [Legionella pneumophila subsp. pneumophila]ANN93351.1 conjugal transfer protein TrbE [Legionella pneumophila]MCH9091251.1 conjugal transfer protein TrbE [Legionella pneumophila serogroup 1]MCH9132797.1 conjugal transfer protein TrbE [Legionella pneumophila serogroup 1]MCZ4680366.1 conjugal transfer protein TrbE [Legionella pneumophila]